MIFTGLIKITTAFIDLFQKIYDMVVDTSYVIWKTLCYFKSDVWLLIKYFDIRDTLHIPVLIVSCLFASFNKASRLLNDVKILRRNERYSRAQCSCTGNVFEWSRAITYGVRNAA